MVCYYTGKGVSIRSWGVIKRDGVLVNRMGCYFPGWSVSLRDGVLELGVTFRDGALIYGIGC